VETCLRRRADSVVSVCERENMVRQARLLYRSRDGGFRIGTNMRPTSRGAEEHR